MPGQQTHPQGHARHRPQQTRNPSAIPVPPPIEDTLQLSQPRADRGSPAASGKAALAGAPEPTQANNLTSNKRFSRLLCQSL